MTNYALLKVELSAGSGFPPLQKKLPPPLFELLRDTSARHAKVAFSFEVSATYRPSPIAHRLFEICRSGFITTKKVPISQI
jgi:hypothetical protein